MQILQQQQGLTQHANYHEICRLLARLKANYQLSELVASEAYGEWISIVATFTIDSFNHWQWAANSVYYLLSLWSRLVASMPYLTLTLTLTLTPTLTLTLPLTPTLTLTLTLTRRR